jgi:hypothetical protein
MAIKIELGKAPRSGLPLVQISTWIDWGEGTVIRPSVEFGYRDLEVVQRLRRQFIEPDFAGNAEDFRLPHRLYMLRKATTDQPLVSRVLDQVSQLLRRHYIKAARVRFDSMERRRAG